MNNFLEKTTEEVTNVKDCVIADDKFISEEVLTYKIAGEEIPMGFFYRLENGVKYTPELLRELITLNQEIIDAHKAIIGMLNTYQASLLEMIGLPKAKGMTWRDLALSILELPAELEELEAVIGIPTGEVNEYLMVNITEIEPDDCHVNCWGDFTNDWPISKILMKTDNPIRLN